MSFAELYISNHDEVHRLPIVQWSAIDLCRAEERKDKQALSLFLQQRLQPAEEGVRLVV